ncbi:DegT/DnrJ/EryC1/StrS family aminotransferase [Chryseobacterium sp.]|uniref:DegT/DnrJ/EryC1/StrS family aminotransferase n=1 Tax=Chryseobacterium sp. TaxID=1871047 RepID=UPI002FC7EB01
MEFRDLKKQYQILKQDIDAAMVGVASSGGYIGGKYVTELEGQLADYVGVKHCISCANGTDALSLALMAWDIKEGDAVFVPDFTFFASAEVVAFEGATPIFVDVENETFNISSTDLERKIQSVIAEGKLTPKVIITVDLFGLPASYSEIRLIADRYNLLILEDGAQGFGGAINGRRACSFGDISTTSFFPAKPLGCYGDGGAIFTDNDNWAELIESLKVHGKGSFKYDNVRIGVNSRLDAVQAAILKVKFKAFREYELEDINKVAAKYTTLLQEVVDTPIIPENYYSSWAQYTIKLGSKEQRDNLQMKLKEAGIPSMVYYPTPMHKQSAFSADKFTADFCPNSTSLCQRVLALPLHPYMNDEDVNKICDLIKVINL